ncbi:MAG: hypothetical protein NVSMB65_15120 [Chloroflexota bacterium]
MGFLKTLSGQKRTAAAAQTADVDVREARTLQQQGARLIDVREPSEFAAGHATGARNIPLGQLAGHACELADLGTVLVICQSGNRNKTAQGQLAARTVADVRHVRGGTKAWRAAGLPLE